MNGSASAPATRPSLSWRAIGSHGVALITGLAIALCLDPLAKMSSSLSTAARAGDDFHRSLQAVMVEMSAAMCIAPSADADRDFARSMIPHHRGAVEMARLELAYGRDERLRRIAQGIVVEQSQEIALMRSILAGPALVRAVERDP
jgi:uncharacterized protein (DUF305 family)